VSGDACGSLPIIFRDDSLIAIHKPAGLLVHRSVLDRHETRFALQMLRDQIGQPVYPVHRLDKGTSGVLLFALDREVGRMLNSPFERGEQGDEVVSVILSECLWDIPSLNIKVKPHEHLKLRRPAAGRQAATRTATASFRFHTTRIA